MYEAAVELLSEPFALWLDETIAELEELIAEEEISVDEADAALDEALDDDEIRGVIEDAMDLIVEETEALNSLHPQSHTTRLPVRYDVPAHIRRTDKVIHNPATMATMRVRKAYTWLTVLTIAAPFPLREMIIPRTSVTTPVAPNDANRQLPAVRPHISQSGADGVLRTHRVSGRPVHAPDGSRRAPSTTGSALIARGQGPPG